ncbi:MAG: hypothetical protein A2521_08935 [Deltaproteobacteria bacterium RIFOXYD12_FULL_57_12]|nr:MAG: hypothetical protein A2521_08935 [Deltaproteobacteria bacterium RIFOXYD12_FULL_57_12]
MMKLLNFDIRHSLFDIRYSLLDRNRLFPYLNGIVARLSNTLPSHLFPCTANSRSDTRADGRHFASGQLKHSWPHLFISRPFLPLNHANRTGISN